MQTQLMTHKRLDQRAKEIMHTARNIPTGSQVLAELDEITQVLQEKQAKQAKPEVVARLTVIRKSGARVIVEVETSATFNSFYKFYTQAGTRRSTKRLLRSGIQTEGRDQLGWQQPGLDVIAERLKKYMAQDNPAVSTAVKIFKRKAYKRLISTPPHQLGLTKMAPVPMYTPATRRAS